MGKANRNRQRRNRHNPVMPNGNGSIVEEEVNGCNSSNAESLVHNVMEKLQSHREDDKLCGLNMLSEVFDGRTLEEVAQNRIVRIAGPLLLDPSSSVRNAAAGALRNLTASGSPEFGDVLVEQDIMTSVCALIRKFGNSWQPKTLGRSSDDEDADTFIHTVNILWNLCGNNATALSYFNDAHILPMLVRCLDVKTFGVDIGIAVAECLNTVTEDNQAIITEMQPLGTQLQQILIAVSEDVSVMLLQVLVAGTLININAGSMSGMDSSRLALIMAALSSTLGYDHRKMLNQLTSELEINIHMLNPRRKVKREEMDEEMDSDDEKNKVQEAATSSKPKTRGKSTFSEERTSDVLKKEKESILLASRLLQAQLIALEVLANLCSGDEEEENMDMDDSESEGMSESSFGEDAGSPESIPIGVSSDVLEAIVSQRLLTKVWDKTVLPAENVCEILHEHLECQVISNRLCLLRSRAFLCLQNLLAVMDLEELGGCGDLYNMWIETTKLVFEKTKSDDLTLLEAATSLMRAAVLRLAEAKATQFSSLSSNDLQILFQGESQCKEANVRSNLIRIVGCIGQMLTFIDSPLLPMIGEFLLNVASRDVELSVTAEALDCIFDVFGEDETDKVAFDIGLVNKLRALTPSLKNKVRMQRKSLGDHYSVVMTATNNLNRFITYKSKRLANLTSNGHT